MRFAFKIVLLTLLAGASAKAQGIKAQGILLATPHYTVSRVQASPNANEDQVVLLMRVNGYDQPNPSFWVAERRLSWRRINKTGASHQWIDGQSCAALKSVMAGIAALPPVKLAGPDAPLNFPPFHLALTTLRGPAAPDRSGWAASVARSDFKGGVTDWWARSEKALETCWTDQAVSVDGQSLKGYLNSQEDADLRRR